MPKWANPQLYDDDRSLHPHSEVEQSLANEAIFLFVSEIFSGQWKDRNGGHSIDRKAPIVWADIGVLSGQREQVSQSHIKWSQGSDF